jgi:hypothetical protein
MEAAMVRIKGFGNTSEEIIAAFEERNQVRLPVDYRQFLLENNGGLVEAGCCHVQGAEQDVLVQALLGLGQARDFDLQGWLMEYRDEMPRGSVIIAVGATGLFILVADAAPAGVHFWDHEHTFDASSTDGGNTYKVAATFTEFINGLRPIGG